jgi:hypothetical protein
VKIVVLLGRMWRFLLSLVRHKTLPAPPVLTTTIPTPKQWPARSVTTGPGVQTLYFDDIQALFDDMAEYTKRTGYPVAAWDDAVVPESGFSAFPDVEPAPEQGRAWRIRTHDLDASIHTWEERARWMSPIDQGQGIVKAKLVREYMKSRTGREKIAMSIPGQRPRRVWWETR